MNRSQKLNQIQFEKIEGSIVILNRRGTQSQHEAWHRRGEVFCRVGSGFIGLLRTGTSVHRVQLIDYDLGNQKTFYTTGTGRIVLKGHKQAIHPLSSVKEQNQE